MWILVSPYTYIIGIPILCSALSAIVIGIYNYLHFAVKREVMEDIESNFMYTLATNHLPHIYKALQLIAYRLEIVLDDEPPILYSEPKLPRGRS